MRRLSGRLFALAAAVSAVLCVVACGLWLWSVGDAIANRERIGEKVLASRHQALALRTSAADAAAADVEREEGRLRRHYDSVRPSPWWPRAAVLTASLPAAWLARRGWQVGRVVHQRWKHGHAVDHSDRGFCPACGYNLRATPGRCPECGAVPAAGKEAA